MIDIGIRLTHADLAPQLWRNPGEIPGNGIDDDGNGYVDDVFGIDATRDRGDPHDDDGHGTHVAGIIGAAANGGGPVVGTAWQVRLMALKFLNASGVGFTSDAIQCVDYAVAKGARILNLSWGGDGYSRALHEALRAADAAGALIVAAAGNSRLHLDGEGPVYPVGYDLPRLVGVAAHDRTGVLASFSNFGPAVALAAPGVDILSTFNRSDNDAHLASGTSAAAPFVSGVAALVLARFPGIGTDDLRDRLVRTVAPEAMLRGLVASGGRLDARRALADEGDGALELRFLPRPGTFVLSGRPLVVAVRVTDLVGVTGATVTAVTPTGETVVLRDDGLGPDARSGDAIYSASFVPAGLSGAWTLRATAEAPGKTGATAEAFYRLRQPAPNDRFADRIDLGSVLEAVETRDNHGATAEPGEPLHAGVAGGASLWWSWTAPGDGTLSLDTVGSFLDTLLAVYTGASVDALVAVAANDDAAPLVRTSRLSLPVRAGVAYRIAVDAAGGAPGTIRLQLAAVIPPPNDAFADALVVTGSTLTLTGDARHATAEAGEPVHGGALAPRPSVWFRWTAPTSGAAFVDPGFVGGIFIHRGDALEGLRPVPVVPRSGSPVFHFGAEAGVEYRFAVVHEPSLGRGSVFTIGLDLVPGQENDFFGRAALLEGATGGSSFTFADTSLEPGEPPALGLPIHGGDGSLWWRWTAPRGGTFVLNATPPQGSGYGPLVEFVSGATLETLRLRASASGLFTLSLTTTATLAVAAGEEVRIRILGTPGFRGPVTLAWNLLETPANDRFADRFAIPAEGGAVAGHNVGSTLEPGEPRLDVRGSETSLWWTWTAPRNATALLLGPTRPRVFTGASVDALVDVLISQSPVPTTTATAFRARAGVSYQFQVGGGERAVGFELLLADPPPNDDFADALPLTGATADFEGGLFGATSEPASAGIAAIADTWWVWTAPRDGVVRIGFPHPDASPSVNVFTGGTLETLTSIAGFPGTPQTPPHAGFIASAGTTYRFRISSSLPAAVAFRLRLETLAAPPNDAFADRIPILGEIVTVKGSATGATREAGEPVHGGFPGSGTLWWSWTAPDTGQVLVGAERPAPGSWIAAYTGANVAALTPVVGARPSNPYSRALLLNCIGGVTYHFAVEGSLATPREVALEVTFLRRPANDDFAAAQRLEGATVDIGGTSIAAGIEPGEPSSPNFPPLAASRWWTWIAPQDATAHLTLTSGTEERLEVFQGGALAGLEPTPNAYAPHSPTRDGPVQRWRFHVRAGSAYHIRVASHEPGGDYRLQLRLGEEPANDRVERAIAIPGAEVLLEADFANATLEPRELSNDVVLERGTLWWRWSALSDGRLIATTTAGFARVGYYRIGSDGIPIHLGSGLPFGNQSSQVVEAGAAYLLQVSGTSDTPVTVRLRHVQRPSNDDFANRIPLSGARLAVAGTNLGATGQPGEQTHTAFPFGAPVSVWWTWTAPAAGRFTASASNTGGSVRFDIAAYRGSSLSALTRVWSQSSQLGGSGQPRFLEVNAGDELHLAVDQGGLPIASNSGSPASLQFAAEAGVEYAIAAYGQDGRMGSIRLRVEAITPPTIALRPLARPPEAGRPLVLQAEVGGVGPFTHQWFRNGVEIAGATAATLTLPLAQAFHGGSYTLRSTNAVGATVSAPVVLEIADPAGPSSAVLLNLSTRAHCGVGAEALIPGFVLQGGTRRILIRAVGPQLGLFGVGDVLPDPRILLKRREGTDYLDHLSNVNWSDSIDSSRLAAIGAEVGAFPLAPDSRDAALLAQLAGGHYTVLAEDAGGRVGTALVELYDASEAGGGALVNVSCRGPLGVGNRSLIAGFVLAGEGARKVLLRAVGPALAGFGVIDAAADTQLHLYRRIPGGTVQEVLFHADDWGERGDAALVAATAAAVGAFPLPAGSRDAALVLTLPAGVYTVHASARGGAAGVGLVEIYAVD